MTRVTKNSLASDYPTQGAGIDELNHEVRTPVVGIRGIIEQAFKKPRDIPGYPARLSSALVETEGLNRLVDNAVSYPNENNPVVFGMVGKMMRMSDILIF